MPQQSISLMLADPLTTADYTDITPLVKQWHSKRGRNHENRMYENGSVDVTLNNQDGRFSPWNTSGPYYNLLTADDAAQEVGVGTWTNSNANCAVALAAPPVVLDGPNAIRITGNGGTPSTTTAGRIGGLAQYAVVAGKSYLAMASFLTSVTARAWTVQIDWYKSDQVTKISSSVSSSINDNTTSWTKATITATAPALAAFAAIVVSGTSLANNEVHWTCRAALFNAVGAVPNTAWAPGQRGLVPTRPIKCTATWASTTYPRWLMYVNNWTPTYTGNVKSEQTISAVDGLALLALSNLDVSQYSTVVLANSPKAYYRMGDLPGSVTAADASGNSNTANVLGGGAILFGAAGALLMDSDTAGDFANGGTTPSAYILPPTWAPGNATWTFEAWIKTTVSEQTIFEWQAGTAAGNLFVVRVVITGNKIVLANGTSSQSPSSLSAQITGPTGDDGLYHHVVVTVPAGSSTNPYTLSVDGVSHGTFLNSAYNWLGGGGAPVGITPVGGTSTYQNPAGVTTQAPAFQGSMDEIAIYTSALSSAAILLDFQNGSAGWIVQPSGSRIAAILSVFGWPAAMQGLATGRTTVQAADTTLASTSVLAYSQNVAATESGFFFADESGLLQFKDRWYVITSSASRVSNATLANDNVGGHFRYLPGYLIPGEDDIDLWNDVPSQRNGGVLQRVFNALSIRSYFRRSMPGLTSGLQVNDNENLAQAQWWLAHYKTPITRVRQVSLDNTAGAGANFPQMLGRTFLDRITLIWQPMDGTTVPLSQDSLIESIEETVTQSTWLTTWVLSPAETAPFFILNDTTYGKLTSGNQLGY